MSQDFQPEAPSDFDLIDVLTALGQEKWTLIIATCLATLIGVIVSLLTPVAYVSRTTIMPSQQSNASSGGLSNLSSLSGLVGLGAISNMAAAIKSTDEMFIALMRSQSVQMALIEQLKLKERYGVNNIEEARLALTSNVTLMADKKSGLISIDAQDKDPEFAAQLANEQVKGLNEILRRLAVTEAQQRRAYYESQISIIQAKIPQLEFEFKEAQKNSGVEVASLISEVGTLPGQIAAKELQLQVLSMFATTQNPEVKRLTVEISALRTQLSKYELSQTDMKTQQLNNGKPVTDNRKANFLQKATQIHNTLKIQEALLDSYLKQLELAKVDEAKEGPALQVVDVARAPEIKAKPERKKLVFACTVLGLTLGFLFSILRVCANYYKSTSIGFQRWSKLKHTWGINT